MSDEIIGLEFTDGRVCYCPRSALTNSGGGYLSARFNSDSMIPPGAERTDTHGRKIYFITRDGETFAKHILPYILESDANLPSAFSEDAHLWRRLRKEALFYAMDGLSESLKVTYSCDKNDPYGRGVLHWLGTDKGRSSYTNPVVRGCVDVTGWALTMSSQEIEQQAAVLGTDDLYATFPSSLQVLVQHRPPIKGVASTNPFYSLHDCYLLWCEHASHRLPAVVDLKDAIVRPTAYSFRYGTCHGARDWNLEASLTGTDWEVLHEARGDSHLMPPPRIGSLDLSIQEIVESARDAQDNDITVEEADEVLLAYVEKNHRHTWDIQSNQFFRYFRIIGPGIPFADLDPRHGGCIHVVGLEIFGNVQEV